ncbi:MAG: RraA family protein [Actinobacteria bacterium]|nr:RraA family protein [Actinomycetota bacterium]
MTVLSSAAVATAGGADVGVIHGLSPAWRQAVAIGPAFTVSGRSGDNLALHRALREAAAGSVIVATLDGTVAAGHWGELMAVSAGAQGIVGLVIGGTVRDIVQLEERRFPVFHRGLGPRPATKDVEGTLGEEIVLDGVTVSPGDLVVADADGVAVVPRALLPTIEAEVATLHRREEAALRLVAGGTPILEALGVEPAPGRSAP